MPGCDAVVLVAAAELVRPCLLVHALGLRCRTHRCACQRHHDRLPRLPLPVPMQLKKRWRAWRASRSRRSSWPRRPRCRWAGGVGGVAGGRAAGARRWAGSGVPLRCGGHLWAAVRWHAAQCSAPHIPTLHFSPGALFVCRRRRRRLRSCCRPRSRRSPSPPRVRWAGVVAQHTGAGDALKHCAVPSCRRLLCCTRAPSCAEELALRSDGHPHPTHCPLQMALRWRSLLPTRSRGLRRRRSRSSRRARWARRRRQVGASDAIASQPGGSCVWVDAGHHLLVACPPIWVPTTQHALQLSNFKLAPAPLPAPPAAADAAEAQLEAAAAAAAEEEAAAAAEAAEAAEAAAATAAAAGKEEEAAEAAAEMDAAQEEAEAAAEEAEEAAAAAEQAAEEAAAAAEQAEEEEKDQAEADAAVAAAEDALADAVEDEAAEEQQEAAAAADELPAQAEGADEDQEAEEEKAEEEEEEEPKPRRGRAAAKPKAPAAKPAARTRATRGAAAGGSKPKAAAGKADDSAKKPAARGRAAAKAAEEKKPAAAAAGRGKRKAVEVRGQGVNGAGGWVMLASGAGWHGTTPDSVLLALPVVACSGAWPWPGGAMFGSWCMQHLWAPAPPALPACRVCFLPLCATLPAALHRSRQRRSRRPPSAPRAARLQQPRARRRRPLQRPRPRPRPRRLQRPRPLPRARPPPRARRRRARSRRRRRRRWAPAVFEGPVGWGVHQLTGELGAVLANRAGAGATGSSAACLCGLRCVKQQS